MGNQFKIYSKNVEGVLYGGKNCGKQIREKIRDARERIWIVSPYIDEIIKEVLVCVAREVDVKIITNEDSITDLFSEKNVYDFSLYFNRMDESKVIGNQLYEKYKVSADTPFFYFIQKSEFIRYFHAKIFLIDDILFLGSVNCTKTGFDSNIELRFMTKTPSAIKSVEEFIENLLKNSTVITDTPKLNITMKNRWKLLNKMKNTTPENWEKLKEFCKDTLQIDEDDEY